MTVLFDYRAMELLRYTITGASNALFLDPAEYELDEVARTALSLSEDEEATLRFDVTRALAIGRGDLEIQFGAKSRAREKSYDLQADIFDGFDGDYTLADVLGRQSYGLATLDPLPNGPAARGFFNGNFSSFALDSADSALESNAADYLVEEDVQAAYALARYDIGKVRLVGGFRYERTDNAIGGNALELVEEGGTRNGVVLDEDSVFVTPIAFERDYDQVLPSLNLRYGIAADLLFRAGLYRNLVRPNIGQLAPRFIVEENDEGEREGEFGNPELEPYEADNLDLSLEWYFAANAVLQGGLFHKTIDNFIVNAEFEDVTFNGARGPMSWRRTLVAAAALWLVDVAALGDIPSATRSCRPGMGDTTALRHSPQTNPVDRACWNGTELVN